MGTLEYEDRGTSDEVDKGKIVGASIEKFIGFLIGGLIGGIFGGMLGLLVGELIGFFVVGIVGLFGVGLGGAAIGEYVGGKIDIEIKESIKESQKKGNGEIGKKKLHFLHHSKTNLKRHLDFNKNSIILLQWVKRNLVSKKSFLLYKKSVSI